MERSSEMAYVGIDVAKETFDACVIGSNGKPHSKPFSNDPAGHAKFYRWVAQLVPGAQCLYCMEATGSYYEALAAYLVDASCKVSVVNPRLTHHFAESEGAVNKTDPADARGLAEYCRQKNPPVWHRCSSEARTLVALMRRLEALTVQLGSERSRVKDPGIASQPLVLTSVQKSIAFLEGEIASLRAQVDDHIDQHPGLKKDRDLLESIKGFGRGTATLIISELPNLRSAKSAKSAAAYAGLAPRVYESGKSVRKQSHMSKRGSRQLRRALYMPAITAARYNPAVKAIYDRLIARGRPKMVALGAAMRKLLMIAYGVLKSQKEFEYAPAQS